MVNKTMTRQRQKQYKEYQCKLIKLTVTTPQQSKLNRSSSSNLYKAFRKENKKGWWHFPLSFYVSFIFIGALFCFVSHEEEYPALIGRLCSHMVYTSVTYDDVLKTFAVDGKEDV